MDKLTLEHLAPYMPYGLVVNVATSINDDFKITLSPTNLYYHIEEGMYSKFIPILRPLSDLTKEIEHNGERFIPMIRLLEIAHPQWINEKAGTRYAEIECKTDGWYAKAYFSFHSVKDIQIHTGFLWNEQYWKIQKLFEWHFDIFGLINKGVAIDINSLKEKQ